MEVFGQCHQQGHAIGYEAGNNGCGCGGRNGLGIINNLGNDYGWSHGSGNVGCGCGALNGPSIMNNLGNGYGWSGTEVVGAYGGVGTGDLYIAGELPVAGVTTVAGHVPILGAVRFGGGVPAAGTVSICGKCDCDCNGLPWF
ncbi:unnamed protein product [Parnassius apollo]|uniref:(apollo) hypothetical protein n=1 Tax=Parnassius apollo TaxID=110799 RepID=A0A8S3Y6B8_PARAO|nr:unnamed protein product [Parnassius apollo]